jgi:hypothetical protein
MFMAEAATLAHAGTTLCSLDINEASFLSHNQQFVTYMNTASNEDILSWEARIYTQILHEHGGKTRLQGVQNL